MKKFIFWSIIHKNINIALNEDLSGYSSGETFWQAMQSLYETPGEWTPSINTEESDINARLKMFYETGINKIEIFLQEEGDLYSIKCANSRSKINADSEQEALKKYVETRAKFSRVNVGDVSKI